MDHQRGRSAGRILLVEDDPSTRRLLEYLLTSDGHLIRQAQDGAEALALLKEEPFDLILTDLYMPNVDGMTLLKEVRALEPDLPVLMLTAHSSLKSAIEAIRMGAYDYLEKPVDHDRLRTVVKNVLSHRRLQLKARLLEMPSDQTWHGMIGQSHQMRWVYQTLERIARFKTPILITGESGTGKELIAQAVHRLSPRSRGPLVAVNSAGVVDGLFESQMFGHLRGSFTGASRHHDGLFAAADGGTLFLDEIGELSASGQARLLRTLETGEVLPVGASQPITVDVRVIAATGRDLAAMMAEGTFRADLYYRLCGINLTLPPLRDRGGDVLALAEALLEQTCLAEGCSFLGFDDGARQALLQHDWPGNIRELRQMIEVATAMAEGSFITAYDLPLQHTAPLLSLEEAEALHVARTLAAAGHSRNRAAELLGVSRHTLYRLMRKHALLTAG